MSFSTTFDDISVRIYHCSERGPRLLLFNAERFNLLGRANNLWPRAKFQLKFPFVISGVGRVRPGRRQAPFVRGKLCRSSLEIAAVAVRGDTSILSLCLSIFTFNVAQKVYGKRGLEPGGAENFSAVKRRITN